MATREIPLTKGFSAIVDEEDYHWLSEWKWQAMVSNKKVYALRSNIVDGRNVGCLMHRAIMGLTDRAIQVDHENGNGLDNRRSNLRIATVAENNQNVSKCRGGSRYLGVCFDKGNPSKPWKAYVSLNKKKTHVGYFVTEVEAAQARDAAAVQHHGVFASLNFPTKDGSTQEPT